MHDAVKAWVSKQLATLWVSEYGGRIDLEGNWITENSRAFKWELRAAKPHEAWQFSLSFCLALAAMRQESPVLMAENLSKRLTEEAPLGWAFEALNGYVNGYFRPHCLRDYLRKGFSLAKDLPEALEEGCYAVYRLEMLQKSLIARSVQPVDLDAPIPKACLERFSELFLRPDQPEEWRRWCLFVHRMTAEGKLIDLNETCQGVLLAFLNEIM